MTGYLVLGATAYIFVGFVVLKQLLRSLKGSTMHPSDALALSISTGLLWGVVIPILVPALIIWRAATHVDHFIAGHLNKRKDATLPVAKVHTNAKT